MKYERKGEALLPFPRFLKRVAVALGIALVLAVSALTLGMLGYHYVAGLDWVDSEFNAAMILTGMGPVDPMRTTGSKLFASAYALFSGILFITSISIVLTPVFHRVVHKFHLDDETDDKARNKKQNLQPGLKPGTQPSERGASGI